MEIFRQKLDKIQLAEIFMNKTLENFKSGEADSHMLKSELWFWRY